MKVQASALSHDRSGRLLFPSNIGAAKKRENVLEIWSWSGEDLNAAHPLLADGVLEGIGSAGTAYNTLCARPVVGFGPS